MCRVLLIRGLLGWLRNSPSVHRHLLRKCLFILALIAYSVKQRTLRLIRRKMSDYICTNVSDQLLNAFR